MKKLFTKHPNEVGETYLKHALVAIGTGIKISGLGLICIIHGFFPFLFVNTASNHLGNLVEKLKYRDKNQPLS